LAAGASIINDVSALRDDAGMIDVARGSSAGIIVMHMQGTPKTMQIAPAYYDVAREVTSFLADRIAELRTLGIEPERVAIDPGIGFGKRFEHNLTLIRELGQVARLNRPVCLGASRKGFIGKVLGRPVDQLAVGTAAVSVAGYMRGANILRVHDVAATRDAIAMTRAIEIQEII
jgi:dihydropteroate synthase